MNVLEILGKPGDPNTIINGSSVFIPIPKLCMSQKAFDKKDSQKITKFWDEQAKHLPTYCFDIITCLE